MDGGDGAARLRGIVEFVPGRNAAIAATPADMTLTISADLDAGELRPCWPEAGGSVCADFIATINGVGPDDGGDFTILGGSGVDVREYPEEHRIVIDFSRGLSDKTCDA